MDVFRTLAECVLLPEKDKSLLSKCMREGFKHIKIVYCSEVISPPLSCHYGCRCPWLDVPHECPARCSKHCWPAHTALSAR